MPRRLVALGFDGRFCKQARRCVLPGFSSPEFAWK